MRKPFNRGDVIQVPLSSIMADARPPSIEGAVIGAGRRYATVQISEKRQRISICQLLRINDEIAEMHMLAVAHERMKELARLQDMLRHAMPCDAPFGRTSSLLAALIRIEEVKKRSFICN